MPECPCRGINPNCDICGGWGMVEDSPIVRLIANRDTMKGRGLCYTVGRIKKHKENKVGTKCVYCGKIKRGMYDHIQAKHPNEIGSLGKSV